MSRPPVEENDSGASPGRIMALDLGTRRIGVALSDPLGLTAQPLLTLERRSLAQDLTQLAELSRRHEVTRIVFGLPVSMDGTRGEQVRRVETFMERVARATGLPMEGWDERLTTVQAERSLLEGDASRARRRAVIDQAAAVILLQSYLDAKRRPGDA